MRVAVVTCKTNTTDNNNEPDDEFATDNVCKIHKLKNLSKFAFISLKFQAAANTRSQQDPNNQQSLNDGEANFEAELRQLMHRYGKSPKDVINIFSQSLHEQQQPLEHLEARKFF